jgi:hypothetical protein
MKTRSQHMRWCKERAREYLDANDPEQAVASMLSDLSKHPETEAVGRSLGMMGILSAKSVIDARKFIEGFSD